MAELTREKIEALRPSDLKGIWPGEKEGTSAIHNTELRALCDLALRGLEQTNAAGQITPAFRLDQQTGEQPSVGGRNAVSPAPAAPHSEPQADERPETDLQVEIHNPLEPARSEPLSRTYTCGCVLCICEGEDRCFGCGAKSCGKSDAECERKQARIRAIQRLNESPPTQDLIATKPDESLIAERPSPALGGDLDALVERLRESMARIALMCSEHRGPKMTVPVQPTYDDTFICGALRGGISAIVALRQEVDDAKDDVARLHKDKMSLWAAINFPGGFKERAEAAEGLLHDSQRLRVELEDALGAAERKCAEKQSYLEAEHDAHMDCHARAEAAERDAARYRAAIEWALGGEGSDFRPRNPGEGAYWWRVELRKRAAIDAAMKAKP